MKKILLYALALNSFISCSSSLLAQNDGKVSELNEKNTVSKDVSATHLMQKTPVAPSSKKSFEAFTGKVSKNKVRLRLLPNYEGQVIREIVPNELFVIVDETEDFYAVKPPAEFKAYIFRTFVLDNVIEGNRVNVRLKPDLEAPVVGQLNSGDKVSGVINPATPKWLEIDMPASTNFYIGKEYVEKVGDADYLVRQEKKRQEGENLLSNNSLNAEQELQKPFEQINVDHLKTSYQHLITDYAEFPEIVSRAKNDLAQLQENYTNKKMAYLEAQSRFAANKVDDAHKLSQELQAHKSKIMELEQQIEQTRFFSDLPTEYFNPESKPQALPINMSTWMPQEEALFEAWSCQTGNSDINYFYQEQIQHAAHLRGVIEPYNRPVKNKPGDYLLVNPTSKLPIAYLYSTQINLQNYVGHEISIRASSRPNNHFAYPAYYVLSVE